MTHVFHMYVAVAFRCDSLPFAFRFCYLRFVFHVVLRVFGTNCNFTCFYVLNFVFYMLSVNTCVSMFRMFQIGPCIFACICVAFSHITKCDMKACMEKRRKRSET